MVSQNKNLILYILDLIRIKSSVLCWGDSVKGLYCFSFLLLAWSMVSIFLYQISWSDFLENYTLMFDSPGNNGGPEAGGSGGSPEPNNGGQGPNNDTLPYNSEEERKRFKN